MPIYAYRCDACGHTKDVLQKLSDAPLECCPACGANAFRKQLTAAGFQLKGSGWYVTDFKGGKAPAAKPEGADAAEAKPATEASAATEASPATDAKSGGDAAKPADAKPVTDAKQAAPVAKPAKGSAAAGPAAPAAGSGRE